MWPEREPFLGEGEALILHPMPDGDGGGKLALGLCRALEREADDKRDAQVTSPVCGGI